MADTDILPDVIINIHKGQQGYGIYFVQTKAKIVVTKLDKGSQAEQAGVQPGDQLISVQDLDSKLPLNNPGSEIRVMDDNYQETLDLVRAMKHCRMSFASLKDCF